MRIDRGRRGRLRRSIWCGALVLGATSPALRGATAWADPTPRTVPNLPAQIQPSVPEVGMGDWTPGGNAIQPGDPAQGGGNQGGGGTAPTGSSDVLTTMDSRPWGMQAGNNAASVGINPNALAATCVMESGCNSDVSSNGSSVGAFQMQPAAYQEGLAAALQANPALASQIVPGDAGRNDPTTEAIAASGYLLRANSQLEAAGIPAPTVADARTWYQFGPTTGPQIAQADASTPMTTFVSAHTLQLNGLSATATVADYRASISNKIGDVATQTVHT